MDIYIFGSILKTYWLWCTFHWWMIWWSKQIHSLTVSTNFLRAYQQKKKTVTENYQEKPLKIPEEDYVSNESEKVCQPCLCALSHGRADDGRGGRWLWSCWGGGMLCGSGCCACAAAHLLRLPCSHFPHFPYASASYWWKKLQLRQVLWAHV